MQGFFVISPKYLDTCCFYLVKTGVKGSAVLDALLEVDDTRKAIGLDRCSPA